MRAARAARPPTPTPLHPPTPHTPTGINNLWRLCAYAAALWDMSRAAAPVAALRAVAWAGVALSIVIILIFEPVVIRFVPRRPDP